MANESLVEYNQSLILQDRLNAWSNEMKTVLFPSTMILGVYLLFGIPGNICVLFIYKFRLKSQMDGRFFIPFLAAVDLMACGICSSFSIDTNRMSVNFDSNLKCKIYCFLVMFFTCSSILSLMVIAVHRYRKICTPFGWQMSLKWKRISLVIILCLSIIISMPCVMFYGLVPVYSRTWNVTGSRCTSIQGQYPKMFSLIYKGFILLSCVSILFTLCALYAIIGKVIYKQMKFRKTKYTKPLEKDVISVISTHTTTKELYSLTDVNTKQSNNFDQVSEICSPGTMSFSTAVTNVKKTERPNHRIALMFMAITFIFLIAFVPKVTLMVYESGNQDFWLTLTAEEMAGYRFLYTLYILNNVVNPYIYGVFDVKFQEELRTFICKKT